METISRTVRIAGKIDDVMAAITTEKGLRAWWTPQTDLDRRVGGEARFAFDESHARFAVVELGARKFALVCEDAVDMDEWRGTTLAFDVRASDGDGGVDVALVHDRFAAKTAMYDRCVGGWTHFLGSLKAYVETGKGQPYAGACGA